MERWYWHIEWPGRLAHLVDLNGDPERTACGLVGKWQQWWPPDETCQRCGRVWDRYQVELQRDSAARSA